MNLFSRSKKHIQLVEVKKSWKQQQKTVAEEGAIREDFLIDLIFKSSKFQAIPCKINVVTVNASILHHHWVSLLLFSSKNFSRKHFWISFFSKFREIVCNGYLRGVTHLSRKAASVPRLIYDFCMIVCAFCSYLLGSGRSQDVVYVPLMKGLHFKIEHLIKTIKY